MIRIEQTITINRPVDEVFDFMTEAGNMFKWSSATEEISQLTPGPIAVGSRFEVVSRFLGSRVATVLEVVEFEKNRKVASRSLKGPFHLFSSTTYESSGDGMQMIVKSEIAPQGAWRILEPILPSIIRKQWDADYSRLREILESAFKVEAFDKRALNISRTIVSIQ